MSARICQSCGAKIAEGARFCQSCGKEAAGTCQACGAELLQGARFCQICGKEIISTLPPLIKPSTKKGKPKTGISWRYRLAITLPILIVLFVFIFYKIHNQNETIPNTGPSPEQIQITTLSSDKAAPASILAVTGSGFDLNSILKVRFSDAQNFSIDCPVINANPTSVMVSVPPYIDTTTGQFASGVVAVQLVQESATTILTSNPIGLQIEDLPLVQEGATGQVTISYLNNIDKLIQEEKENLEILDKLSNGKVTSPELVTLMDKLQASYTAIKTEVESVLANPSKSIVFAKMGDDNLELNISTIHDIDRLITAMKYQVKQRSTTSPVAIKASGATLRQGKPNSILLHWKEKEPSVTLLSFEIQEDYWLTLKGQQLKAAMNNVETCEGYAGTLSGWAEYINETQFKNPTAGKYLGIAGKVDSVIWAWRTLLPATLTLREDLSSITAATDMNTWEKIVSVDEQGLQAFQKYVEQVGPGAFDLFLPIPFFGTLEALGNILGPEIRPLGGILVTEANLANKVRAAAKESGDIPYVSGLGRIQILPSDNLPPKPGPELNPGSGPKPDVAADVQIFPASSTIELDRPNLLLYADVNGIPIEARSSKYVVEWSVNGKVISTDSSLTTNPFIQAISNKEGTYIVRLTVRDKATGAVVGEYEASVTAKKPKSITLVNHWVSATPGKGTTSWMYFDRSDPMMPQPQDLLEDCDVDLRIEGNTGSLILTVTSTTDLMPNKVGSKYICSVENWKDDGKTISFTYVSEYGSATLQLTRTSDGHLTAHIQYPPGDGVTDSGAAWDLKPAP
jgi:hypothetical protein